MNNRTYILINLLTEEKRESLSVRIYKTCKKREICTKTLVLGFNFYLIPWRLVIMDTDEDMNINHEQDIQTGDMTNKLQLI